jgi:hypothetical protein
MDASASGSRQDEHGLPRYPHAYVYNGPVTVPSNPEVKSPCSKRITTARPKQYQFAGPEQGSTWISTNVQQSSTMIDDGSQPGTGPCAVNRFQPCMSGSSRGPRATHEDNVSTTEVPPPDTVESDVRETYHDLNLRRRNMCA